MNLKEAQAYRKEVSEIAKLASNSRELRDLFHGYRNDPVYNDAREIVHNDKKRKGITERASALVVPEPSLNLFTHPPLPERSPREFPKSAITMANTAIQAVYPGLYGSIIPEIENDTVLLATDKDVLESIQKFNAAETHSLRAQHERELMIQFNAEMPNLLRVWTIRRLPGKPIMFYDGDLRQLDKNTGGLPLSSNVKQIFKDALVAQVLVHEGMHRIGDPGMPMHISYDNPLFQMAFTGDIVRLSQLQGKVRELLRRNLEISKGYAATHNPYIITEGARVSLFCEDADGVYRNIASSGYDLEEAVVDYLGKPVYEQLIKDVKKTGSRYASEAARLSITDAYTSGRNYMGEVVLLNKVPTYLRSLGLSSPEQLVKAMQEGKIPLLHAENKPLEPYFT